MHVTSYLLAPLLTAAPASVYAHGCQHFETVYHVSCDSRGTCQSKGLDSHKYQLKQNKDAWEAWAKIEGNGGYCGGKCEEPVNIKPAGTDGTGTSWAIRCRAARMHKAWASGPPSPIGDIQRIDNYQCNVHCKYKDCYFDYGVCHPGEEY
ncbi:hypothetical protein FKW77_009384 [Venturia effusa]|uniref:Secreted protein n=1 Tax=Venturia effusa TaxID=50376 RepID=A0A517LBN7_9PEZI|nr:hypothetical protein FKW77_009384 [Venturia effusa]